MEKKLPSEMTFLKRRMIAAAGAGVIVVGFVSALIGHENGLEQAHKAQIQNGVACDIRVAPGETAGDINGAVEKSIGPVNLVDLDSNGVLRTAENSQDYSDPRKYPQAGDILHGQLPTDLCIAVGGHAVKGN